MCLPECSHGPFQPLESEKCLTSSQRSQQRLPASDRNKCSFPHFCKLAEGTEVVSLMIRRAGQLPQAQPIKRAPNNPGDQNKGKADSDLQNDRSIQEKEQLSMEFLEAVPGPKESVLLSKASHFLLSPVTTSLPAL